MGDLLESYCTAGFADRCSSVEPSLQQTQSSVEENDDASVIIGD